MSEYSGLDDCDIFDWKGFRPRRVYNIWARWHNKRYGNALGNLVNQLLKKEYGLSLSNMSSHAQKFT